jgi:uncharacterized protein YcfJ
MKKMSVSPRNRSLGLSVAFALGAALLAPLSVSAQPYAGQQYNHYDHYDHHRTHTVCRNVRVYDNRGGDRNNVAGTAIGAVAGGLLGHTVGGGNGKTLVTVGGAVAGGYVGNRVENNHHRGRSHIERQCRRERY